MDRERAGTLPFVVHRRHVVQSAINAQRVAPDIILKEHEIYV